MNLDIVKVFFNLEKNSKLETNSVVLDEELKKPEKIQTMYRGTNTSEYNPHLLFYLP